MIQARLQVLCLKATQINTMLAGWTSKVLLKNTEKDGTFQKKIKPS